MADGGINRCVACCLACCNCCWLLAIILIGVLVPAYGPVSPVRAAVKDASLSRFALANGTTALTYDLSLTVALRNRNWAMQAEHAAPFDAELRFAGRVLDAIRVPVDDGARRMDPHGGQEFPMWAVSSSAPQGVELGGDAAAEFVRQSVAGVFELELRLTGAFRYRPVHVGGRRKMDLTCPLKLRVGTAPATPGTHFMVPVFGEVVRCY